MPNVLLTPQIIANEALVILRNQLIAVDLFYRDYSSEFNQVGDTISVRKPAKLVAKDFKGQIERQDLIEEKVPVVLDRFKDISVTLTTKEQTLDLANFSTQVIAPAMAGLAQAVDHDACAYAYGQAKNSVIAKKAEPDKLTDIADISKTLDKNKAPIQDRNLILSPDHKYRYALTDNLSKVSFAGTNETLRDALLGKLYTLNTFMDQNMPASQATAFGTARGTVTVSGTNDTQTITISGVLPATGTVAIGDGVVVDGEVYHFTTSGTATAGTITNIAIDKKLRKTFTAATGFILTSPATSVAFQKRALGFVTRQLDLPMGAVRAAIASDPDLALSVRVVYGYDQDVKKDTISFDILYGFATFYPELAVRLYDDIA